MEISILDAQTLGFVWYWGGIERGQGWVGLENFGEYLEKGRGGKRVWDRKSNTQHQSHYLPISFLTSFSHEISLKLESSTFSLPPFTTCDVTFYMYIFCCIKWKWNLPFLFPPFDTCDVTFWLNQYLSLIKFASIPYPWTNEERMNHRVNIKNEVKPGAK